MTNLAVGEYAHLDFPEQDVSNLWQVTACGGGVSDDANTYGKFQLFFVDDTNLQVGGWLGGWLGVFGLLGLDVHRRGAKRLGDDVCQTSEEHTHAPYRHWQ